MFARGLELASIQARLEKWWEHGDQETPCILITTPPQETGDIPDTDVLVQWWTDVEFVIAREMALINNRKYYGQAVPFHFANLASSAMAGVLGARMEYLNKETIWAYPTLKTVDEVIDATLDHENFFYRRLREITEESVVRARDHHYVAMFALGGAADNVAGLYGTENMLMDMILKPDRVAQALERSKQLWLSCFEEFSDIIAGSGNRGTVGWAGIWAPGSTFPMQEDCSYMISSEMFDRFCLPHIRDMVESMAYPLYHLDGIGALNHLDSLLEITDLKAIQWVPGAGRERLDGWYDVIGHILDSGKSVQVYSKADEIDGLVKNVGARGLLVTVLEATDDQAEALMEKWGKA